MTRALAAFAAAHPRITVEIDTSNAIHDLLRDDFDFAIRVDAGLCGDLVARRLWQGQFGLFAAPGFVRAELHGRPLVTREQMSVGPASCCGRPPSGTSGTQKGDRSMSRHARASR